MAHLKLRILFDGAMLGPGKAELLERIRDTGSISAAGRAMGMSYKRAWSLVDEMNAAWAAPLVQSSRGGAAGGGAVITQTGLRVLTLYREVEAEAARVAGPQMAELEALRAPPDMSR